MTNIELVNFLNDFFISVNADIPAFDISEVPAFLPAAGQVPLIHTYIPPRLLKECACELAVTYSTSHYLQVSSLVFGKPHILLHY